MVVKNEEETLVAALESVKDIVDEIVIGVDDSSTDHTPQIAAHYASPGKCFSFTWRDDFSWARNEAIKRASSDLIFILDGHEFVPPDSHPVAEVMTKMRHVNVFEQRTLTPRSFIEQVRMSDFPRPYDVVCINLAMNTDFFGIPQLFFLQPRIFRNDGKIHYSSAVHNYVDGYPRDHAMGCPEGIIVHNMPPKREAQRKAQRKRMNVSGLYADHRTNLNDARPLFYLGNTHADLGDSKKAAFWYRKYLKKSRFGEERYQVLQQLAILEYRHFGNHNAARELVIEATHLCWNRKEPYILLAEIAYETKQYDEAIHWLDLADEMPAPVTVMFLQGPVYSYMCDLKRMECFAAQNNLMMAIRCSERVLSWRPGDPQIIDILQGYKNTLRRQSNGTGDKNMLIVDKIMSFTEPIAKAFAGEYTVVRRQECDERWKGWADVAWFEWCDENIALWSHHRWNVPVICRLHSYESFGNIPPQVDWDNVDHLVFVADHIRDKFNLQWPDIQKHVEQSTIPNGVDASLYAFRERGHGKTIGYLGYFNNKKGIDLLVQAMWSLPDYMFRCAGQFQDPHLLYYFQTSVAEMHNVIFDGWIQPERKDEWLEEVDYLISPSIVESFGFSIAEAMCKGIKPLIHHRVGAIWHETWRTIDDLRKMLEGPYESREYRSHIERFYSLEHQLQATKALVKYLVGQKHGKMSSLQQAQFKASPIVAQLRPFTSDLPVASQDVEKIVQGDEVHG